jgi:folylpolyglutamate synthase/dihydropteroate synthase
MDFNIPTESIYNGIKANRIPARIEMLETSPPVILDGSHNL